ncbi:MAG: glycosyltransferase [Chloroherpetonaceae bacterium]|nr:glycosyltransferase [Chloroherpetonaceae bacterium]
MPKASVILAVHNGERFLAEAIRSVEAQTMHDLELVVVDDASTDRTAAVLNTILPQVRIPVQHLRNEKNLERCYARNRGAEVARGEYLFFLDYDDVWKPHYIETSLAMFEQTGADAVCAILRSKINERGELVYVSRKKLPSDVGILIASALVGGTPGLAFRKASFPKYDDAFRFREDWEIVLRAFLSGLKIAVTDSDQVWVREHSARTSRAAPAYYRASKRIFDTYYAKVPLPLRPYFEFEIGNAALRHGDLGFGWSLALCAMRKDASLRTNPRNWLLLLRRGFRLDRWLSPALR